MSIRSLTVPQTWTVHDLMGALDPNNNDLKLELPRFQRAQVWGKSDQRALISSIHEGHPIGSLLLYEVPGEVAPKKYLLVDGLQRTTAVRDYSARPLALLELDALTGSELDTFRSAVLTAYEAGEESIDLFESAIEKWMRATGELHGASGFNARKMVLAITEVFAEAGHGDPCDIAGLEEQAEPLLDAIRARVDIGGYSLPVIVFQGGEGELPDIFEKINARGTKLNKYEVFAATWVNQETEIRDDGIRDAIADKYAGILAQGFEIPGLENGEITSYSLFEYLFGLGKLLAKQYPLLFGASDDPTSIESIGFTLATVAHGLRLSEMKKLPLRMLRRDGSGPIDPSFFQEALFDAADYVNETLRPYVEIKLNSQDGSPFVAHTEYQVASMILRILAGRYVTGTWEEREGWEAERTVFRSTLPQYYLYDTVQQNWRGSGDSRLFSHVWSDDEKESRTPSAAYRRVLTRQDWDRALDDWFEKQKLYAQKERSNIKTVDRLFLKFVYCDIVTLMQERQQVFEIDHLFPVKRLVDLIGPDEDGWPISAVANLALFDWKTNREKTKFTIGEYVDNMGEDGSERLPLLKRYLLCEVDDVRIPHDSLWGRQDYVAFLSMRFARMKEQVYSALGVVTAAEVHEDAANYSD